WSKRPLRRSVLFQHRQTFLDEDGGEGRVGEHLLGDFTLRRHRTGCGEVHGRGSRRSILSNPFEIFLDGIDGGWTIGVATTRHAGADRARIFVNFDAPFVDGKTVWDALVAVPSHGEPCIREAPAE